MEERSPSQRLTVTLPLLFWIPPPLMQVEGISTSLLPEEQVRSTQLLEVSIPILREEMEERSPSQRLAVTLPLLFWIPPLMQVEGISTSLLPEEQVRSTQQMEVSIPILRKEREERSNSQLLTVT